MGHARRSVRILAACLASLSGLLLLAAPVARAAEPVDLQLVLAVDISRSMDEDEQVLQRQGYAAALTSPEVLSAIAKGHTGKIAVAYVEWGGAYDQQLLIDWQVIDGPETAGAFVATLLAKPYRRVSRTSISGGLMFSLPLFAKSPYEGERKVIDVSGDGANNQGIYVTIARDAVLAEGITINGLPILIARSYNTYMDVTDLDAYYADCVVGGENAFVVPIKDREDFLPATRRKILQEIANLPTPPRVMPTEATGGANCQIGERIWQERMGNWQ